MECELAILKDIIITDAYCSRKVFFQYLSNGNRKIDSIVNTLVFYVHPIDKFYYKTENFTEIEEIIKGIENKKKFTIKYKKSSHEVIEIISETNTQEQYMGKYNEILKLKEKLFQHGIPFEFSKLFNGYYIYYPSKDNVICSVIEHDGSYRREEDKLKIQGLLTEQELEETDDAVLGHLTAEDAFTRINKHFENLTNPNNIQPVFPEQDLENANLIKQLAKCSDKIKELEQKIAKKKKKISKLKAKNSNFEDTINNLVSENKYLNNKHKTIEASCIEASKSINIIKEILNKQNIDSETKLSEIRKTLS